MTAPSLPAAQLWSPRISAFLSARSTGIALAGAFAAVIWMLGVRRYTGTNSFFELQFIMGPTVQALVERGTSCAVLQLHNFQLHDVQQASLQFCAHRRLLVPLLLAAAYLSGLTVVMFAALKALIASFALTWSVRIVAAGLSDLGRIALYVGFILIAANPWFLSQMVALEVEEAYAIPLFAILTALLLRPGLLASRRPLVIAALSLFGLVMLKSSYVAVAAVLAGALILRAPSTRRALRWLAPSVLMALTLVALGNGITSGRFATGSSIDWWNAYKGNNELTSQYYRESKLDQIPLHLPPSTRFADEWEFDRFFRTKTLEFLEHEPFAVAALAAERLWNYFGRIDFVASANGGPEKGGPLGWHWLFLANLPARLLFLGSILLVLRHRNTQRWSGAWLLVVLASAAPHVLGFAYFRHVTPLLVPSALIFVSLWFARTTTER